MVAALLLSPEGAQARGFGGGYGSGGGALRGPAGHGFGRAGPYGRPGFIHAGRRGPFQGHWGAHDRRFGFHHGGFGYGYGRRDGVFGGYGRFGYGRYGVGFPGYGLGYSFAPGVPFGVAGGRGEFAGSSQPTVGIPPSPVLPPAVYVIGRGGGGRVAGEARVRGNRRGGVLSSDSGEVGSASSAAAVSRVSVR